MHLFRLPPILSAELPGSSLPFSNKLPTGLRPGFSLSRASSSAFGGGTPSHELTHGDFSKEFIKGFQKSAKFIVRYLDTTQCSEHSNSNGFQKVRKILDTTDVIQSPGIFQSQRSSHDCIIPLFNSMHNAWPDPISLLFHDLILAPHRSNCNNARPGGAPGDRGT